MKVRCINNTDFEREIELEKIYEVRKENLNYYYIKNNKGSNGGWLKNRFEEVKGMTKDDLKTGMVVECRDGRKGIVFDTHIFKVGNTRMDLDCVNSDLTWCHHDGADIMKVYEANNLFSLIQLERNGNGLDLLWEREEKSPLQLELDKLEAEKAKYDRKFEERLKELKERL